MLRTPRSRPAGAGRNLARMFAVLLIVAGAVVLLLGLAPREDRFDHNNAIGASGNAVERMDARGLATQGLLLVCAGLLAGVLAELAHANATLSAMREELARLPSVVIHDSEGHMSESRRA